MIIITIAISIIYIILLILILKAYYRDVSDTENRLLQLEKSAFWRNLKSLNELFPI